MNRARTWFNAIAVVLCAFSLPQALGTDAAPAVRIGSKVFTESVILGDILQQLARAAGANTEYRRQLGGTRVLWEALRSGEIDAYPEYTGTLVEEILRDQHIDAPSQLQRALAKYNLRMTRPLGFNNTYALGVTRALATKLHLESISDLRDHPGLVFGFSNEFMDRSDGWAGLQQRYDLPQQNVRGLDHDLAYRGLAAGTLDVIDIYTTDAEIPYYHLRPLEDDRHYFPAYDAVILYRADLQQGAPEVVAMFKRLGGRIDATAMRTMNAQVKLQGKSEGAVAAAFLQQTLGLQDTHSGRSVWQRVARYTLEHLILVGISLGAAIAVSIPLGILAARRERIGQAVLAAAGLLQTIPSLALFVFMIPLLGIGGPPAIVALFLYSLLPIIRNTYTGLKNIPQDIVESAQALGLSPWARLRLVELPLATRSILAGIKISAVINVGTATLGALIGAGGYGQPILTGIRLDDVGLILQGAVPAAIMALLVQGLFELIERGLLPKSLRHPAGASRASAAAQN